MQPESHHEYQSIKPRTYRFRIGECAQYEIEGDSTSASRGQPLRTALLVLKLDLNDTYAKVTFYELTQRNRFYFSAVCQVGDSRTCFEVCSGSIRRRALVPIDAWWSRVWSKSSIKETGEWAVADRRSKYPGGPSDIMLSELLLTEAFFEDETFQTARNSSYRQWASAGTKTVRWTENSYVAPPKHIPWIRPSEDRGIILAELQSAMPKDQDAARNLVEDTIFAMAREVQREASDGNVVSNGTVASSSGEAKEQTP